MKEFIIILIILFVGATIFKFWMKNKLLTEYQAAIASGDKARALQAGRAYYSYLRGGAFGGGKLTIYDEQAITNDLNTMKVNN